MIQHLEMIQMKNTYLMHLMQPKTLRMNMAVNILRMMSWFWKSTDMGSPGQNLGLLDVYSAGDILHLNQT
ncbi:hypothetical protein PBY51_020899 [Eleginops maclovinus]|uniref:Uncharacterized protein n=1 Tax=Eleginops maclovinus TaxID=56733 RepID=A0AAN7X829_ELEMC|nr:hypothetical protein PBY51_002114 [Eleginops maclovinus]KAK5859336.1 hypothetical protein PBY51_020899 [Eleginops maclovinus]